MHVSTWTFINHDLANNFQSYSEASKFVSSDTQVKKLRWGMCVGMVALNVLF